jgi:hypothetical protein
MAEKLGRSLKPDEHVHHRDHDSSNDGIKNLKLLSTAAHTRLHHKGRVNTAKHNQRISDSKRAAHKRYTEAERRRVSKATRVAMAGVNRRILAYWKNRQLSLQHRKNLSSALKRAYAEGKR